jgi:hypothetical protein
MIIMLVYYYRCIPMGEMEKTSWIFLKKLPLQFLFDEYEIIFRSSGDYPGDGQASGDRGNSFF